MKTILVFTDNTKASEHAAYHEIYFYGYQRQFW